MNSALQWSRHDDSNNNRSGSSCSGSDDEYSITVPLISLLGRPVLKCRQYDDDIAQLTTMQHGSKEISHYLLPRGFLKKSGRQPTPTSSSTSSFSSSSMISPKMNSSEVHSFELCDDTSSINSYVQDLSTTSPEQTTSKQLFVNGDFTEHYVLENIKSNNRGYCSLLVADSTPLIMEFNLDETCSEVIELDSSPGTHRWMLFKDIALEGTVVIYA